MSIRLLTQNCYWTRLWNKRERFAYINREIEFFNPDVVCLQEVVFPGDERLIENDELTLHKKRGIWSNKGGLVTFVRNEEAQSQIWNKYKSQGAIVSWQIVERFMGKGFQAIKLERNGVWIINTHLSASHSLIEKPQKVHIRQVEQLLEFVADKPEVVLVGDLNITPFSDAYKLLCEEFQDCSTHLMSTFPRKAQTLDYVFYKGNRYRLAHSSFLRYQDAPVRISDHFGLVVELTNQAKEKSFSIKSEENFDTGIAL